MVEKQSSQLFSDPRQSQKIYLLPLEGAFGTQRVTSVYNMRQAGFPPDPPVTGHGEEGIKTECMSKTCRPKEFTKTQALGEFQNQIQPIWRALGQGKRLLSLQEKPEQTGKDEPAERGSGGLFLSALG